MWPWANYLIHMSHSFQLYLREKYFCHKSHGRNTHKSWTKKVKLWGVKRLIHLLVTKWNDGLAQVFDLQDQFFSAIQMFRSQLHFQLSMEIISLQKELQYSPFWINELGQVPPTRTLDLAIWLPLVSGRILSITELKSICTMEFCLLLLLLDPCTCHVKRLWLAFCIIRRVPRSSLLSQLAWRQPQDMSVSPS